MSNALSSSNKTVLVAMQLVHVGVPERTMLKAGYHYHQLVLPGFELLMGVQ